MSEPVLSSAVVAIVVYGCLPTLGIGLIWYLSGWTSSHWHNELTATQPETTRTLTPLNGVGARILRPEASRDPIDPVGGVAPTSKLRG